MLKKPICAHSCPSAREAALGTLLRVCAWEGGAGLHLSRRETPEARKYLILQISHLIFNVAFFALGSNDITLPATLYIPILKKGTSI